MSIECNQCKIRIVKELSGVYPKLQPKVGGIYDARYVGTTVKSKPQPAICVIEMLGKKIVIRNGEYEIVEGGQ